MKEELQVRAELIEHQHDALIAFHSRYSRNFVSKLLMRLAENMIEEYPPNLANFLIDDPMHGAHRKKITVRISIENHPSMWEFYQSLPHGGKAAILMNVLNGFVQAAEVDRSVMEKAFWGLRPTPKNEVSIQGHHPTLSPAGVISENTFASSVSGSVAENPVLDQVEGGADGTVSSDAGLAASLEGDAIEEQEVEPYDPLMDVTISL